MIGFLAAGLEQCTARSGIACHEGLTLVEGLCGDLSRVVDPHEAGHFLPGGWFIHRFCNTVGRGWPMRLAHSEEGSQGLVCWFDQAIDQGKYPVGAGKQRMRG